MYFSIYLGVYILYSTSPLLFLDAPSIPVAAVGLASLASSSSSQELLGADEELAKLRQVGEERVKQRWKPEV